MNFLQELYSAMYPEKQTTGLSEPVLGLTLFDVRLRPVYSDISPQEVSLAHKLGALSLGIPFLSAAMDTVSGPKMAMALAEMGGCGVIYRHKDPSVQLSWVQEALKHRPCLVAEPKILRPDQKLESARDILEQYGFSTIPVVKENGFILGILFTRDIAWGDRLSDPVKDWMMPLADLKTESPETPFNKIKERLLNEQKCSVLPIIDSQGIFKGIYFMKDFINADPAWHKGQIAVGMAIGVSQDDLKRASQALDLGVALVVIDSSHGDCDAVIRQTQKIVEISQNRALVVAGNIADPGGYYRLAQAGADVVKCGIGSGSICTTSQVTGAAFPMFTLLRELDFVRRKMREKGMPTPSIIADGGINGTGEAVIALAAGADALMAGKWFVAAQESQSCQDGKNFHNQVYYRGMASKGAIEDRLASERYDRSKRAPEGVEGSVPFRGTLKAWLPEDLELVRGGLAHVGAKNIASLHEHCRWPLAFIRFTGIGQSQIFARVNTF